MVNMAQQAQVSLRLATHIYHNKAQPLPFYRLIHLTFTSILVMRQLQTIQHLLLMSFLLVVTREKVVVEPSSTSNPYSKSVWMTWPQSTNKTALTLTCPSYHAKLEFQTSDGIYIGMVVVKNFNRKLLLHCRDEETKIKNWSKGNLLRFSTKNWGICSSGATDTLIIERTSVRLKIMRGDVELFNREWEPSDGKCLLGAGFWRLENLGTTSVSAASVLGKEI